MSQTEIMAADVTLGAQSYARTSVAAGSAELVVLPADMLPVDLDGDGDDDDAVPFCFFHNDGTEKVGLRFAASGTPSLSLSNRSALTDDVPGEPTNGPHLVLEAGERLHVRLRPGWTRFVHGSPTGGASVLRFGRAVS